MNEESEFRCGYIMGLIVGEGYFTRDGLEPCMGMKLSAHDPRPLEEAQRFLGGRLYGPYMHDGRYARVWLLRGQALRRAVPILERYLPESRKREQFEAWRAGLRFEDPAPWTGLGNVGRGTLDDHPVLPGI